MVRGIFLAYITGELLRSSALSAAIGAQKLYCRNCTLASIVFGKSGFFFFAIFHLLDVTVFPCYWLLRRFL